jgi:hypothetical protein
MSAVAKKCRELPAKTHIRMRIKPIKEEKPLKIPAKDMIR